MDWMGFGWAGSTQVPTVSARHLHAFLEVGKDFSDWVKGRVDAFGFVEGQDFVVIEGLRSPVLGSAKSRAQTTKEYHLSIDMAKELSMVERNEKGKQARRYFIERERRTVEGSDASMGRTTSASIGAALTTPPNETETPLVGAAGGL
jgi:hypothetical protein